MADGTVTFATELDAAGIKSGLDGLQGSVNKWGAAIVGSKAFAAISEGIIKVAKAGVEYNAQMEAYQTNFAVLLGDEAAALEHVAQMREMAAKTPFGMEDLASANQTLLSFGMSAEQSMEVMQQLGDISLGNKERFSSLSLAFAQVSSAGKLTGQDLLQMINSGFNPLNTLAEATSTNLGDLKDVMGGGKGSKEFQKQMKAAQKEVQKLGDQASEGAKLLARIGEEGMISAEMVGIAMEMETSPGGKFYKGMEQASKTMTGMWSTLQDDAMQLAGNVFKPISDVLTDVVLPAAIGAVGALNGLFEQDGKVELSLETQEAVNTLNGLDESIQSIKNKYVSEAIQIKIDYQESMNLLDQLAQIQAGLEGTPKRLWSDQDKADLQALTEQLVALNPELDEHVGRDGIINLEAEAVRNLVVEYKNLALQRAAAAAQESAWNAYFEAELAAETIRNQNKALQEQVQAATATGEAWTFIADTAGDAWDALTTRTADMVGFEQMTAYVGDASAAMQAFIDITGGLDAELFKGIDTSAFFDGFQMLDAAEIAANADAVNQLGQAMAVIADAALEQEGAQQAVVAQLQAQIQAGNEAIAAAESSVAEALNYANAMSQTVQDIASGVTSIDTSTAAANTTGDIATVQEAGEKLSDSEFTPTITAEDQASETIDTVEQNATEFAEEPYKAELQAEDKATAVVDAATAAGEAFAQKEFVSTLRFRMANSPASAFQSLIPGYADGLEYVPYDNYLALLHKGERVLTAEEAAVYNRLTDPGFASRLATRAVGTGAGIGDRVIREAYVSQTNNFNVPVQTPDEFAQMMREFATYGLAGR